MVARRDLEERDALVARDALDVREQAMGDAALPLERVDDHGEDPDERSSVSNRGRDVEGDEADDLPPASATMTRASGVEKRSIRAARSLGPAG